jgi:hypothetical protein
MSNQHCDQRSNQLQHSWLSTAALRAAVHAHLAICNDEQDVELAPAVIDDLACLTDGGRKRGGASKPH